MPIYEYVAYDEKGKRSRKKNMFEDKNEVIDFLSKNNLYATKIKVKQGFLQNNLKLKYNDLYFICSQLSILISSGCDIIHSLNTINSQSNKKIQLAINPIIKKLKEGNTLAQSFQSQNLFSLFFINMISSGELSGNLDYIMEKLGEYYNREKILKQKIISSLVYPVILMIVCTIVVIFLLIYVVPNFETIFSQNGINLPFSTKLMLNIANMLKRYYYIITFFMLFGILITIITITNNKSIKYKFDKLKTQIIYIKNINQLIVINKFIRSFYILITGGVQIVDAIQISAKVVENQYIYERLMISKNSMIQGEDIYTSLKKSDVFPVVFLTMIQVGEQGGKLDKILLNINEYYEKELNAKLNKLMKLIEPIIIAVMGLIIGVIVISIAMPMFDIMNNI